MKTGLRLCFSKDTLDGSFYTELFNKYIFFVPDKIFKNYTVKSWNEKKSKKINTSGPPPSVIPLSLESAANNLGGIGAKVNNTTVGCCGEFRIGASLLTKYPQFKPTDIKWTDAIRPRDGTVVPMCAVCGTMFTVPPSQAPATTATPPLTTSK